jgi:hypothetical protein
VCPPANWKIYGELTGNKVRAGKYPQQLFGDGELETAGHSETFLHCAVEMQDFRFAIERAKADKLLKIKDL